MTSTKNFAKVFFLVFLLSFAAATGLYFGFKAWSGLSTPFICPAFKCRPYWEEHPIPYLAALAFAHAFVSAGWQANFAPQLAKFRKTQIILLPLVSLLLAGYISGIIWAYQDMQTGSFPELGQLIQFVQQYARLGFSMSLLIAVVSFPLNIFGYLASILVTLFAARKILLH